MKSLTLYASDANRNTAFLKAGVWMIFSVLALVFTPFGMVLAAPLFAIGFWFGGPELGFQGARHPSFKADTDGFTVGQKFSVTDRHRLSWDEFRGVELRTVGFVPFLQQRVLVVMTENHGDQKIRQPMMSGTPEEMADVIQDYAKHAMREADLNIALAALPAQPLVGDIGQPFGRRRANPMPTAASGPTFAQMQLASTRVMEASPVQAVPRLSDRLFGRRRVI